MKMNDQWQSRFGITLEQTTNWNLHLSSDVSHIITLHLP